MKKNIVPLIALIGGTALIIVAIFLDNGNLLMFWSVTSYSLPCLAPSQPLVSCNKVPKQYLLKQIFIVPSDSRLQLVSLFHLRKARKRATIAGG